MSTTLFLRKTESYIEMFFSISFYYRSSCIMQKKFKTIYFFTFWTYFYCEPHVLINIGYDIFSNCFYCTCFVYIYYILYILYIYMYIFMQAPHVHVLYMYMMSIPALGNPQVGLADLRIESTIRIFYGFENCGFLNKGQKQRIEY